MHTDGPKQDPLTDLGYETRDVSMNGIGKASAIFFGFALGCFALTFLAFRIFGLMNEQAPDGQMLSNIPAAPNPLLQTNTTAKTDIQQMRQRENEILSTTTWLDRKNNVVRIPIDRAIDLTVQQLSVGSPSGTPSEPNAVTETAATAKPSTGKPTPAELARLKNATSAPASAPSTPKKGGQ